MDCDLESGLSLWVKMKFIAVTPLTIPNSSPNILLCLFSAAAKVNGVVSPNYFSLI